MSWYEDRFTNFFAEWKRGHVYLKDKKSYYGSVEKFEIADRFEESTITFKNLSDSSDLKEMIFPLKDVIYFRASDGPIFNVSKYLSIITLQRSADEVEETLPADREKEMVCVAFGLEFYSSPEVARVLKSDVRDVLMKKFKDYPLVFVQEKEPVEVTPTINSFVGKIKSFFKRRKGSEKNE